MHPTFYEVIYKTTKEFKREVYFKWSVAKVRANKLTKLGYEVTMKDKEGKEIERSIWCLFEQM